MHFGKIHFGKNTLENTLWKIHFGKYTLEKYTLENTLWKVHFGKNPNMKTVGHNFQEIHDIPWSTDAP